MESYVNTGEGRVTNSLKRLKLAKKFVPTFFSKNSILFAYICTIWRQWQKNLIQNNYIPKISPNLSKKAIFLKFQFLAKI